MIRYTRMNRTGHTQIWFPCVGPLKMTCSTHRRSWYWPQLCFWITCLNYMTLGAVTHLGGSSAPSKSNMDSHNKWLRFYGKIIVSLLSKSNSRNSCKPHVWGEHHELLTFLKNMRSQNPQGMKNTRYEWLRVFTSNLPEFYLQLSFNGPKGCTNSPSY